MYINICFCLEGVSLVLQVSCSLKKLLTSHSHGTKYVLFPPTTLCLIFFSLFVVVCFMHGVRSFPVWLGCTLLVKLFLLQALFVHVL
jgi:hypothetical protein